MSSKNDAFVADLLARERELRKEWVPSTASVIKTLAEEFAHYFREEGSSPSQEQIYLRIGYYLRKYGEDRSDTRTRYTKKELKDLVLMSAAERKAFATRTCRTLATVNEAMARYKKRLNRPPRHDEETHAQAAVRLNEFFDFCDAAELRAVGVTREEVQQLRKTLTGRYGLSLRSPNILYHPATKKRYRLSLTEQKALLAQPHKFIRMRADYIRTKWEVADGIDS